MPKPPPLGTKPDPGQLPPDKTLETGFFEVPPQGGPAPAPTAADPAAAIHGQSETPAQWAEDSQVGIARPPEELPPDDEPPLPGPRTPLLKIVAGALALVFVLGGVLFVRRERQRRALREGLDKAAELIRTDTSAGYAAAADLLKSLVPLDPVQAGSMRAFALGMLVSDYREEARAKEAEALLVEPERAPVVPPAANLAEAALLLSREAGTATTFAARAPGNPWSGTLQARVALAAGNSAVAVELVDSALAIDPGFPAALALKGDMLRRRRDYAAARDAYAAALRASPLHPRAAFGMAKLALSDKAPREQATGPLERMIAEPTTPANERGRAALHLAALRTRFGDRSGAEAAIETARVPPAARPWLERAVSEEAQSHAYRVVGSAPPALQSAHDDDPYEPPPQRPPAVEKPKPAAKPAPVTHAKGKAKASKKSKSKTAKAAKAKKKTPAKKKVVKKPATDQ